MGYLISASYREPLLTHAVCIVTHVHTHLDTQTQSICKHIYRPTHSEREGGERDRKKLFFYYYFLVFSHPTLSAEEGSGITQDDLMEFLTDDVDDVIIKCYVCPNSSAQSCEMESLRQNPDDYLSQCSGHCMNISTGTDQS